jgi:DNA-binding CsgD family transcriptional regulator
MEKLNVIIATESYVVNQGFHLIFNKLRQSHVVEKLNTIAELNTILEKEKIDLILLSTNLIQHYDLNNLFKIIDKNQTQLIAYILNEDDNFENQNIFTDSIHTHDSKEIILRKLNKLMDKMLGETSENESSDLSEREKDILKEVAQGLTNNEIADKLFISAHTVITHRKKITKKLGIKSVSGLTVYAIINGLIEMEDVGE